MSKIGRMPISIGDVQVEVKGQEVHYKGPLAAGVVVIPQDLKITLEDKKLRLVPAQGVSDVNRVWGLHRALLANAIRGAGKGFEKQVRIVGLGYKALKKGEGLEFSLGFSHKVDFALPKTVSVDIDKTGQLLTIKSSDKQALGSVCSQICDLRPVEPYKGTGIFCEGDIVRRKAGKAKV